MTTIPAVAAALRSWSLGLYFPPWPADCDPLVPWLGPDGREWGARRLRRPPRECLPTRRTTTCCCRLACTRSRLAALPSRALSATWSPKSARARWVASPSGPSTDITDTDQAFPCFRFPNPARH